MKKVFTILTAVFFVHQTFAQYYIKGEVRDEQGNALQNVKIYLPESNSLYSSGVSGGFGIPTRNITDSLVFSLEGYLTKGVRIKTSQYQKIVLEVMPMAYRPAK